MKLTSTQQVWAGQDLELFVLTQYKPINFFHYQIFQQLKCIVGIWLYP